VKWYQCSLSDNLASSCLIVSAAVAVKVGRVRWKKYHGRKTLARPQIPNRLIVGQELVKWFNCFHVRQPCKFWLDCPFSQLAAAYPHPKAKARASLVGQARHAPFECVARPSVQQTQLPAPNHAVPTGPGEAPEPPWRGSRSAPPAVTPLVCAYAHVNHRTAHAALHQYQRHPPRAFALAIRKFCSVLISTCPFTCN
jgi:hypothetical protein